MSSTTSRPRLPVLLRDLPTPPEVAAKVREYGRAQYFFRRHDRAVEEEYKLSYYFGGRTIIAEVTEDRLRILAAGHMTDKDFAEEVGSLYKQPRRRLVHMTPEKWGGDDVSWIGCG